MGAQNKLRGWGWEWRFFLNLINKGVKINGEGGGISQNSLILVNASFLVNFNGQCFLNFLSKSMNFKQSIA